MRLPRFRVRTLLVLVAVAGVLYGGEVLRRRRVRFLQKEALYARFSRAFLSDAATVRDDISEARAELARMRARDRWAASEIQRLEKQYGISHQPKTEQGTGYEVHEQALAGMAKIVQKSVQHADYYRGLEHKYARAARYPWLMIEPDPPVPD